MHLANVVRGQYKIQEGRKHNEFMAIFNAKCQLRQEAVAIIWVRDDDSLVKWEVLDPGYSLKRDDRVCWLDVRYERRRKVVLICFLKSRRLDGIEHVSILLVLFPTWKKIGREPMKAGSAIRPWWKSDPGWRREREKVGWKSPRPLWHLRKFWQSLWRVLETLETILHAVWKMFSYFNFHSVKQSDLECPQTRCWCLLRKSLEQPSKVYWHRDTLGLSLIHIWRCRRG